MSIRGLDAASFGMRLVYISANSNGSGGKTTRGSAPRLIAQHRAGLRLALAQGARGEVVRLL